MISSGFKRAFCKTHPLVIIVFSQENDERCNEQEHQNALEKPANISGCKPHKSESQDGFMCLIILYITHANFQKCNDRAANEAALCYTQYDDNDNKRGRTLIVINADNEKVI